MSASTKRKNRQAEVAAGSNKKSIAAREEALRQAKSKRRWTWGLIGVGILVAAILFFSSNLFLDSLTAVKMNGESYNRGEVGYYTANQYYNFLNSEYGQYASLFGLDTSSGIAGLASQECGMAESGSWLDYFTDLGIAQMKQVKALCDQARAKGMSLSSEELKEVTEEIDELKAQAEVYGYGSFKQFLSLCYGAGVTEKIMRKEMEDSHLATKFASEFTGALEYTDEELDAQYDSYKGAYDTYGYSYVTVNAEIAEGAETPTDEAVKAAKATAEAILAAFKSDKSEGADVDKLNAAATAEDETLAAYENKSVDGASLGIYADFMQAAGRKAGDAAVVENSSNDVIYGYNVVCFGSHENNKYNTVSVRHILVMAEADENGIYTEEALGLAELTAKDILAEWKSGEATEESFAALADSRSDDGGSVGNGGLYENIVKGQMVPEFEQFCFAGHKPGDVELVNVQSSNYAGTHIIYFVGEGEQYNRLIAKNELMNTAYDEWIASITEGYTETRGAGLKFMA